MTSADDNRELIRRLYEALGRSDGEAMAGCYAPNATFRDPVFGTLKGDQPGDMWRMLTGRSRDLKFELAEHEADQGTGRARWIASYTFTPTKRSVVNEGRAEFRFADGKIVEHRDRFSMHRWASQALGPVGVLFGWSPPLVVGLRFRARKDLARFSRRRAEKESGN
ncbi:MAG: nuclear transport factor 2 family protein [Actinomycetota bacterium]